MEENIIKKLIDLEDINLNNLSEKENDEIFQKLNSKMIIIYKFILSFNEYINSSHNYTEEENLSMLEAHLLTDICDIPNSTVTSLANLWNRSKSATSQTIRKLMEKDLIYRINSEEDGKIFYLFPTDKGIKISEDHKKYDIINIVKTLETLNKTLTIEEINIMLKGIQEYYNLLENIK